MDLDAKVVGQLLQDVPLGTMLENLGVAIVTAQERLDNVAIDATMRLANAKATLYDADGREITRSLLELGFMPTFYQFTEATLEVSFIASMQVAEALRVGFGFNIGGQITSAADAEKALEQLEGQKKEQDEERKKQKDAIYQDLDELQEKNQNEIDKIKQLLDKEPKDDEED